MDRVTWRLEVPAGWGQRLDPAWLPNPGADDYPLGRVGADPSRPRS